MMLYTASSLSLAIISIIGEASKMSIKLSSSSFESSSPVTQQTQAWCFHTMDC